MLNLYIWDAKGVYTHSIEADPAAAMPQRSTPTAPPTNLQQGHVALWEGQWTSGPEPLPLEPGWGETTPLPGGAMVPARAITYWAFRKRFTHAERVGMELAALDDPTVDLELRQRAASVRVYLADAAAAAWIDLDDPDTRIGVQALEDAGLIAAERSAEILDTPVMLAERPAGAT